MTEVVVYPVIIILTTSEKSCLRTVPNFYQSQKEVCKESPWKLPKKTNDFHLLGLSQLQVGSHPDSLED